MVYKSYKDLEIHKKSDKGLLYTKMKVFHFKDKLDSLSLDTDKILPPIHIRIKPTNICNHNCWYCAYKADNLQLGKDMVTRDYIPQEKMLEIIDDIVEMGVKAVTFSGGGDPFCYPYLLEVVKKLSQTTVKFASLTNGSRLSGELAEIFAHKGTWLRISIDGWDDESYSSYRQVAKGEFTKVMKNISDFKKMDGECYLGISLIVDKKNFSHIYNFVRRIKELNVDSVKVSPCIVSNNGLENDNYHYGIFDAVRAAISKAKQDLEDKEFEIFDAYHRLNDEFNKQYVWCPYSQVLPVIGADLNIYPCQDKAYNFEEGLIGSIKDCHLKDFWFADKSKFFKINPSLHCQHRCVADSKNRLILDYIDADRDHSGFV